MICSENHHEESIDIIWNAVPKRDHEQLLKLITTSDRSGNSALHWAARNSDDDDNNLYRMLNHIPKKDRYKTLMLKNKKRITVIDTAINNVNSLSAIFEVLPYEDCLKVITLIEREYDKGNFILHNWLLDNPNRDYCSMIISCTYCRIKHLFESISKDGFLERLLVLSDDYGVSVKEAFLQKAEKARSRTHA